jgi:phage host-nuclease inhibitor protein Gam
MPKLADKKTTLQSLEEAADLFVRQIIPLNVRLIKEKAMKAARIARINADHASKVAPIRADLVAAEKDLSAYIQAHPERFQKPRHHACDGGKFGLQTSAEVVIANEEALAERLLEDGLTDCVEIKYTFNKTALKKRIEAGQTFPGATLKKGDIAHYTISRELIDQAKGEQ